MRQLQPMPWSTVVVLAILAILLLAGHNGNINRSLLAIVLVYLGLETAAIRRRR